MGAANKGGKMWVQAARGTEFIHKNLSLKFSFSWEQYDQRLGCRLVNVHEYRKGSQQEQEWRPGVDMLRCRRICFAAKILMAEK